MAAFSFTSTVPKFLRPLALAAGLLLGAGLELACAPAGSSCTAGTLNCQCVAGQCQPGLQCLADYCVMLGPGETGGNEDPTGDGDGDGDPGDGDGDNPCDGGQQLCGGKCVDTQTNILHCGGCNIGCDTVIEQCHEGSCVTDCSEAECEGFTYCDGDTSLCLPGCDSDSQCGNNEWCDYDAHECVCADGYVLCGDECIWQEEPCADNCGNGVLDVGEVCDGNQLGGYDCTDFGFLGGALVCAGDCQDFDTSGCSNVECGDGVAEENEECDGNDLQGETCMTQGFDQGTLACSLNCTLDTSGCSDIQDDGDCCMSHGTPGCEVPNIETCVCGMDSFCCDNQWDNICVGIAIDDCGASCP